MAHIIAQPCIGTKDTACVTVCPVDCIHPTKEEPEFEAAEMLYIDPDTCIDCNACVTECPVKAIYPEREVPENEQEWIARNAEEAAKFPALSAAHEPLKGPKCVDPNAG